MSVFSNPRSVYLCSITLSSTAPRRSGFWCHRSRTFRKNIGHCSKESRRPQPSPLLFGPYSDGPWYSVFRRSAAYYGVSKSFWTITTDPRNTHGPQQDVHGTRRINVFSLNKDSVSPRSPDGIDVEPSRRAHSPS